MNDHRCKNLFIRDDSSIIHVLINMIMIDFGKINQTKSISSHLLLFKLVKPIGICFPWTHIQELFVRNDYFSLKLVNQKQFCKDLLPCTVFNLSIIVSGCLLMHAITNSEDGNTM